MAGKISDWPRGGDLTAARSDCILRVNSRPLREREGMEASVMDLRKRMRDILRAIDRNESVTLFYRGRKKAVMRPIRKVRGGEAPVREHPAFGMWKDRKDLADVGRAVRNLRKGRHRAL